jgi:hypothetical protein
MVEAASSMVFHYMDTKTGAKWTKSTVLELSPEVFCRYNLSYSIDDGHIVIAVYDGKIYVAPDFIWWESVLQEKGFQEEQMNLEMPDDNTMKRWWEQYDKLLSKWQYYLNLGVKAAIKEAFQERGIEPISDELLSHCLRVPDYGIELTRTPAADGYVGARNEGYSLVKTPIDTVIYYPMKVTRTGRLQVDPRRIGSFGFHDGVAVFMAQDGNTYVTWDYAVVEALEEAGFVHATSMYVPFANGERILSSDIELEWHELQRKFAPELSFCWTRAHRGCYPRIMSLKQ